MKFPITIVVCGTCGFKTSGRQEDSAKASMVDHLAWLHGPEQKAVPVE